MGGAAGELGGDEGGDRGEGGAMGDVQRREARWSVPGSFKEEDRDEGYDGATGYMHSFERRDDDVTEDPAGLSFLGSGAPG